MGIIPSLRPLTDRLTLSRRSPRQLWLSAVTDATDFFFFEEQQLEDVLKHLHQ